MKKLLQIIVCVAALAPFTQVQAAKPGSTNYYGLKPGAKFTLKVVSVVSTKASLSFTGKSPIPSGIPKLKEGQKVTFGIGSKGELKGPDFALPLKKADVDLSVYLEKGDPKKGLLDNAVVKKASKKVNYTQLNFFKTTGVGTMNATTYFVVYVLQ